MALAGGGEDSLGSSVPIIVAEGPGSRLLEDFYPSSVFCATVSSRINSVRIIILRAARDFWVHCPIARIIE